MRQLILSLTVLILVVGCSGGSDGQEDQDSAESTSTEVDSTAIVTLEPTSTDEPEPTPTTEPTNTPEPSSTPTSSPTATATSTATSTPTVTPTPEPTPTPTPTLEPTPIPTSTPLPAPKVYQGSGDSVVDIEKPDSSGVGVLYVRGNAGSRHFAVQGFDAANESTSLFVNTTDPYEGITPGQVPKFL